jgi:hypothetical protein
MARQGRLDPLLLRLQELLKVPLRVLPTPLSAVPGLMFLLRHPSMRLSLLCVADGHTESLLFSRVVRRC